MSSTKYASARWRKKKLEEDAQQFRAKEALRIKNHRARKKGKTVTQKDSGKEVFKLRDASELSDDVDAWLNSVVEDHRRSRSSHTPSFRSTSRASSSTHSSGDSHSHINKDDDAPCHPSSSFVSFQDAQEILVNGQKTLQEWNTRWGTIGNFSFRAAKAFLDCGLNKASADNARKELIAVAIKGKELLLQLESLGSVDFQSIRADRIPYFWKETFRLVEAVQERIDHANSALQLCDNVQTRT